MKSRGKRTRRNRKEKNTSERDKFQKSVDKSQNSSHDTFISGKQTKRVDNMITYQKTVGRYDHEEAVTVPYDPHEKRKECIHAIDV